MKPFLVLPFVAQIVPLCLAVSSPQSEIKVRFVTKSDGSALVWSQTPCGEACERRENAASVVQTTMSESMPGMRVFALGQQKDEITLIHSSFATPDMRAKSRDVLLNSSFKAQLCRLDFVKVTLRPNATDPGDTYQLRCSPSESSRNIATPANDEDVLEINYDRFKDTTYVSTKEAAVENPVTLEKHSQPMTLTVAYWCKGQTQTCYPKTMEVLFIATTSDWLYSSYHPLNFIADGHRLSVPAPDWDGKVIGADNLREFMDCNMATGDVLKLAEAENVEGHLGFITFRLSSSNVAALRALVRRVKSAQRVRQRP
jgi:hypothetical protein